MIRVYVDRHAIAGNRKASSTDDRPVFEVNNGRESWKCFEVRFLGETRLKYVANAPKAEAWIETDHDVFVKVRNYRGNAECEERVTAS